MVGPESLSVSREPGVISLAFEDVLRRANAARSSRRFRLRFSALEVYNEQCNDLLAPERANLKLYETAGSGVHVSGLSEWDVSSSGELEDLLRAAERQRHVGATASNDRSSRSHLLCTLNVDSWAREPSEEDADDAEDDDEQPSGGAADVLSSTLQLVDLAGSERRQTHLHEGQQVEGASINKSLLTLSTIIHRLAELSDSNKGPGSSLLPPPLRAICPFVTRSSRGCCSRALAVRRTLSSSRRSVRRPAASTSHSRPYALPCVHAVLPTRQRAAQAARRMPRCSPKCRPRLSHSRSS